LDATGIQIGRVGGSTYRGTQLTGCRRRNTDVVKQKGNRKLARSEIGGNQMLRGTEERTKRKGRMKRGVTGSKALQ